MSDYYLLSTNGKLSCSNDVLVYSDVNGESRRIFPHLVERIVSVGALNITASAMSVLMSKQIPVYFMNKNGSFRSSLDFAPAKNVFLRQAQYRLLDDEVRRLDIAKSIVAGKLRSQLRLMQRHKSDNELKKQMKDIMHDCVKCINLEQLRGCEGIGANTYFHHCKSVLPTWIGFEGRSTRPPKDVFNSVLSFLYSLLYQRLEGFIVQEGLDPAVGVFHELAYGRKSLTCDLIEEFRVPLCDSLAFALFNRRQVDEYDFICTEDKGIRLNDKTIKLVIGTLEKKLHENVTYNGGVIPYWLIIQKQVHHFRRVVEGKESDYVPVYFR